MVFIRKSQVKFLSQNLSTEKMTIVKGLRDKIKIPRFASSAFKYTAANFLNAIVPVLLLPVLTAYLSKEDYGLVSLFQVMTMTMLPFIGLNSQSALEREYFNARHDFSLYATQCILLVLASGATALVLTVIFSTTLSKLTDFPYSFLWSVPVYCLCNNLCEILLSIWRVKDHPSYYGAFRVCRTLIEISISVFLVTVINAGWKGRVEAMVVTVILFSFLAIFFISKTQKLSFKWVGGYVKDIVKFGAPLIPHTLGGVIMIYSDRVFITKMTGLANTGSYTVGYQVAMAIYLLQTSFNQAWVPWLYSKLEIPSVDMKQKIVRITYLYFVIITICALLLTLASPIIFKIFVNKSYHDSIQFVFWIALGFAFDGMYKMVVNYIFFLRKTYIISIATFGTAALNVVLNYFFIQAYGPIGAAKATTLSMLVEFVVIWVVSHKLYPMPWFNTRLFLIRH
jgi:O-antigen/teichoic acid export membrane protein